MAELPSGTVTFLFTDVEGSTRLWEEHPAAMKEALTRHDAVVEEIVARHDGVVVRPRGEGDSRFAVFARASDAVAAAVAVQMALEAEPWPIPDSLRVRMALHTGEADLRAGDYYGSAVNRCARLRAIAHGGQVVLSQTTRELVRRALPEGATLRDLGEHRLRDLAAPEHVYQLVASDGPSDFPPLRSLDALSNNLPTQLTSFIGREQEVGEVGRLLGTTRLLTLTGAGGTGKTRLALQVATGLVGSYPDGVWLVDLAPLADPGLVAPTIATALGIAEQPGQPVLATLLGVLRAQTVLLLLDNCEHLVDACARVGEALLRACPGVRILATSREALGLPGEVAWGLPSLPIPPAEWRPTDARDGGASLADYAAVELFVARARLVDSGFRLTGQNAAAVAQICRRLDGIPLALELAAARVKVFAVERIAGRLDDRFRLLTGGSRTALPRHQTLRALIDWSYNLLSEPERRLFCRLSVFAGGCSYEAIEGVCADEGVTVADVPDLLTRLVERSLVDVERGEAERYRLLETLRQYGRDRLVEAGEAERARDRHRDWFLRLAEQAKPELIGPDQVRWLDQLEAERDNFRAALAWTLDHGEGELGLRLAAGIWRLWLVHDHLDEGRDWLSRVLAAPGAQAPTAARAEALHGAAQIANFAGNVGAMRLSAEECLAIYQGLADQRGIATGLYLLSMVAFNEQDFARNESLAADALARAQEAGSDWVKAQALEMLALAARRRGDGPLARRRNEESLAIFRALGDRRAIHWSLNLLGMLCCWQGDVGAARAYLHEGLAIARELRGSARIGYSTLALGILAQADGDYHRARASLEEVLVLARRSASRTLIAPGLFQLALLARAEGDLGRAEELVKEISSLWGTVGPLMASAESLWLSGILAIQRGSTPRGVRLVAAYAARNSQPLFPLPDDRRALEESIANARASLGDAEYERAWAEGQAMTLEEAVADALADEDA